MTNKTLKGLGRKSGIGIFFGLLGVLALFMLSGFISYVNTKTLNQDSQLVTHTHEVLSALDDVLSLTKDAETGQRGFLLTGEERYLEPYTKAVALIDERLADIIRLTRDNIRQQERIPVLKSRLQTKLSELEETIKLRRTAGFEAAKAVVITDRGKNAMDAIRAQVGTMEEEEQELRAQRILEMDKAYELAIFSGLITGLVGVLLSAAVAYLLRRGMLTQLWQEWLQSGQLGLAKSLSGDPRLEQVGENVLGFLARYLNAQSGAFFAKEGAVYRRKATYGVPAGEGILEAFDVGDSLLGQAVKDSRLFFIEDVPEGYLSFGSSLGKSKPRHLLIVPVASDGIVNGLFELGFVQPLDESIKELLEKISTLVAIAIRSANYRAHLQNLLEETQRQSEELQTQSEELRVSNEELEEQGRALRESQTRLEQQQAELEQTNSQLEEQAQQLEIQRDDVTRSKTSLEAQARELEQANRYKSDFLANMSHELRTPLNSSLILAKLLADNREGNLTEEQIKYAETIQAAGNDLLSLINDILDLSKIEAGHMEIRPEPVRLSQITDDLRRVFQPVAEHKKIEFITEVSSGSPDTVETDQQRLEQVLKNLLSNAIKFTEEGAVTLHVSSVEGERLAFAVHDTGIGIAENQQQMVFEAFRQADGTTNRKYGGTGLGLSIARELTRLLGGYIELKSEPGKGSTFTVTIPMMYDIAHVQSHSSNILVRTGAKQTFDLTSPHASEDHSEDPLLEFKVGKKPYGRIRRVPDDRERLSGNQRVILVIEDDESFARIMYDLTHELGFQCLIANTAEEGLAVAAQYRPSAVILDVGLPDHSGLSVLDRLKHDSRTRHLPVHVVSAHDDHTQTALALGAVGYMLKPVKREQIIDALERLETRLDTRLRRVLIVEDDAVQLDSLQKLLGTHDVETVGAGNGAECLTLLKNQTFDCMVLDLTLPDASGYSLLETLSREDAYSFPPVIVYTGRDLSTEEEDRLRRYSKSIIIKGAKSPERLLDEVTLFLHQMVSELPAEQQRLLEKARGRDAALEGRKILIVEDDVRNVFALTSILEPRGAVIQIARNGREALTILEVSQSEPGQGIDLILMDIMMPEMDGVTATREIRKRDEWRKLPIIALTAKAMKDDQELCLSAGANDYMAKPLDVEKLLSLIRVWMPR